MTKGKNRDSKVLCSESCAWWKLEKTEVERKEAEESFNHILPPGVCVHYSWGNVYTLLIVTSLCSHLRRQRQTNRSVINFFFS